MNEILEPICEIIQTVMIAMLWFEVRTLVRRPVITLVDGQKVTFTGKDR